MDEKKVCAFTGHRNLNSGGFDSALLDRVIVDLIKTGTTEFLCGMALGFDMQAAQCVLAVKKTYGVKLTACLPCGNQSEVFTAKNRELYEAVIDRCDEVIILSPYYYSGCMHERDRYMVDKSDVIVSYLRKKSGGTFYTVNYARKLGKKIIEL